MGSFSHLGLTRVSEDLQKRHRAEEGSLRSARPSPKFEEDVLSLSLFAMPSLPRLFTGSRAPSIHSALAEPSTSPPSSPPPSPTPARVKIERSSPPPVSPKEDERPLPHRGFSLAVPQQGSVLPTFHQQSQSERDDAQTAGMSRALRERPSRETMRSRRRVMSPTGTAASAAR